MHLDGAQAGTSSAGPHLLVVSHDVPSRDGDSASARLFRMLELLARDGHAVTLVGLAGHDRPRATARLAALDIDVFPVEFERLPEPGISVAGASMVFPTLLAERRFDIALLCHYDIAEQYLPLIRGLSPLTRTVVDTVAVHHLRERRAAELTADPAALAIAERIREREEAVYGQADALIAVSAEDAAALHALVPHVPRFVVSNPHAPASETRGFEARSGVVFIGDVRHTPSTDAVVDFQRNLWALIQAGLSGAHLTAVGSSQADLDAALVAIAPLHCGDAAEEEIGEALRWGLPVVTTSTVAEGMKLSHGENILVADGVREFADAVLRLSRDRELWEQVSAAGRAHVARAGHEAACAAIRTVLNETLRRLFVMPADAPIVAEVIVSYADTFAPEDRVSLVLTVSADDPAAAQLAFDAAAATLTHHGVAPDRVADIQIVPTDGELVLPANSVHVLDAGMPWRELALAPSARKRPRATPRAAILIHALGDHPAVSAQLRALERADLPDDVELVVAADAPCPEVESRLSRLGPARIIRSTRPLGRYEAWQLAAHATKAPFAVGLAARTLPGPGFVEPLLAELRRGAAMAGPVVSGAAGLRIAADHSLWPCELDEGAPDALALDCLASTTELMANGLPLFAPGEGYIETQLAHWARQRGPLAVARQARVERLAAPPATVIICTRNRAEELSDGVALLLRSGAQDVIIVDNDSTDATPEIAAELARRSRGVVRVVHEPQRGLSYARNAGAVAARHDLLLFLDDDARPAPGWLENLAWVLARPGVVNAGGPICGLWPAERPDGWPGRDIEMSLSILDRGQVERAIVPPDVVFGANWAVRRHALEAIGGFDPEFGWGPESQIAGEEALVAYRLHRERIGASVYAPSASVGHRIATSRIDDCYMINRALSYGVEWPRIAHVLGEAAPSDLLGWASSAMHRLLTAVSWTGELSVPDVLGRISALPDSLVRRANMAQILGELAVSAALLEHDEVVAGECRLRIQQDTLLRGILADAAPRR